MWIQAAIVWMVSYRNWDCCQERFSTSHLEKMTVSHLDLRSEVVAATCYCVIRTTVLCSSNVTEPFSIKIFFPPPAVNLTRRSFMWQV